MNYKANNKALTVCEVKISYRPKVKPSERPCLKSPCNIYKLLMENNVFDPETIEYKEYFKILFFNSGYKLLGIAHISEGTIDQTTVDIRHIMQLAILSNAVSIILCHNHPSGNCTPSRGDDRITQKLKEACAYFDIILADHLIVSPEIYYSYADNCRIL